MENIDTEIEELESLNLITVRVKTEEEALFEDFPMPKPWEDYSDEALFGDEDGLDAYDEKSLKQWFKEKWVDLSRPKPGGGFEPCGRDDADKGKHPKCVPASKASKMKPSEIASAIRRKRKAEATQQRDGKNPIYVPTKKKDALGGDFGEKAATPTDKELYERVKAEARAKFDVYPSAYANAWLVREYKKRGGGYKEGAKEMDADYVEEVAELTEKQLSDFIEWVEEKGAKKKPRLKDPKGGLTAAGRAYFKRTQGANLKPGVRGPADTPEKMRRKGSFLTRFFTSPSGPLVDDKGRATRLALSAAAWGEPVPKNAEDAARLASKGRRLLERYENTKKRKKDSDERISVKSMQMSDEERTDEYINSLPDEDFNKMFPDTGEWVIPQEEKWLFDVGTAFLRRSVTNRKKRKKRRLFS